jgi:arylsulfatase A-like enzyme
MRTDRPNIVIVVLDSVRRDHLGCYGHHLPTTPNIDRIAEEGVRYENAAATSCWTLPSHASLFTGLYPSQHGVDLDHLGFGPNVSTLAEVLSRRGYASAAISCNGFITARTGLTRGFDASVDVEGLHGSTRGVGRVVRGLHRRWRSLRRRDRGGRRAIDLAARWIRARKDEPFLLFVNLMECHLPYSLDPRLRLRFVPEQRHERALAVPQDPFGVLAGRVHLDDEDIEDLRLQYDGCLRYVDDLVGRLDDTIAAHELRDCTALLLTSDHGESFGEKGLHDHQYGLYEHLVSVPLVARYPGRELGGSVDCSLVQLTDLYATAVELAGASEGQAGSDGLSLLSSATRTAVYAEYLRPNLRPFERRFPNADVARHGRRLRSIRVENDKLILSDDGARELYDLGEDPKETTDLAKDRQTTTDRLLAQLENTLGPWPESTDSGQAGPEELDDMRERLRALGYL